MHAPTDLAPAREECDWSGWEKWLQSHLDIEREALAIKRETLIQALGEVLAETRFDLRDEIDAKIKTVELKLAELRGAVDILRGAAPPPPAKFTKIEAWEDGVVFHEGDLVAFAGGTFQAERDTARQPGANDWVCLAKPGNSLSMRGTYDDHADYRCLDATMINGSTFVSLKDKPGPCPGSDWQLLCSRGSRGDRGLKGERGLIGPRGEHGQAAATIQSWQVDRARYAAIPIMSDGSEGPALELRGLFEQFVSEQGE